MYFWQKWSNRCKNELAWERAAIWTCILSFSFAMPVCVCAFLPACISLSACCLCVECIGMACKHTKYIRILYCCARIHTYKCEFNKPSRKNEFSAKQRICEQKAFRETSFLTCNEFIAAGSHTVPRSLALFLWLFLFRPLALNSCASRVCVCVRVLFICLGMLWGFSFTECCAII